MRIPDGVELVVDGLLMVPAGGFDTVSPDGTEDWTTFTVPADAPVHGPVQQRTQQISRTMISFASGIEFAAVSGSGVIDGGAVGPRNADGSPQGDTGNVGRPNFPHAWLTQGDGAAQGCNCGGIRWGTLGDGGQDANGNPNPKAVPPRFVHVSGVTVRNTLRSCITGALSGAFISGVTVGDSLTDHGLYLSDADQNTGGRTLYNGVTVVDLRAFGYWRGGVLNMADAHVLGMTVRDVTANPANLYTYVLPGDPSLDRLHYPARKLGTVVGPRPYRVSGSVHGLNVYADFSLLTSIVAVRGRGYVVTGDATHTGAHDAYRENPNGAAVPLIAVEAGAVYKHLNATGGRVALAVHRAPARTRLFDNGGLPCAGLDLALQIDYHPDATDDGGGPAGNPDSLLRLERSVDGLRAHVEAFERSPRGGGPRHLVSILGTTATAERTADEDHTMAEPGDDARRVPPATGVRGVVLSGRVHTAPGTVAAPVRWWFFGEDALDGADRLVARELTVVSQRLPVSAERLKWRHEDVTYLVPVQTEAAQEQTYVVGAGEDAEAHFAHGLTTTRADRVTITDDVTAVRPGTGGNPDRSFFPGLYGIDLDAKPLPPLLEGGPVRPAFTVHFDEAIARTENSPGGAGIPFEEDDEITVSWQAERYERLDGDIDGPLAPLVVTAKADGTPKLDYDVAHGLAGPPAVWRVTRAATGETVKATLVGEEMLKVKFGANDGLTVDGAEALWLSARLG